MIYFDNAATTRACSQAAEAVNDMLLNCYANPSSLHSFGFEAERRVNTARKTIANCIGAEQECVYFTSGGTEANNLAVLGAAEAYKKSGLGVITTGIEHPSVLEAFHELKQRGFDVKHIGIDKAGKLNLDELCDAVSDDTVLISIMHVNNEVGTIQDIEKIAAAVKGINNKIIFHTDNVQGFGKHRFRLKDIDLMSFSSHKIHGPKGVGGLYVKRGIRLKNMLYGGQQQDKLRPGTENTPAIVGFGIAAREAYDAIEENYKTAAAVKQALLTAVSGMNGVKVNGAEDACASPYILNLSFEGVKAEVLLHALEKAEIYVSTGSACSSKGGAKHSAVRLLDSSAADSAVRFSFSSYNTVAEAQSCARTLIECVEQLRKYRRR